MEVAHTEKSVQAITREVRLQAPIPSSPFLEALELSYKPGMKGAGCGVFELHDIGVSLSLLLFSVALLGDCLDILFLSTAKQYKCGSAV